MKRRANTSFVAKIEDFVKECPERMMIVMRSSIQDTVLNAQLPGPSVTHPENNKGGRMRVDTGFLRASGMPMLNQMPSGDERGEKTEANSYEWKEGNLTTVLSKMKIGDKFYFGWTAEYALYRETYDGFLEGSLQHWSKIVAFNTDTVRKRIKK